MQENKVNRVWMKKIGLTAISYVLTYAISFFSIVTIFEYTQGHSLTGESIGFLILGLVINVTLGIYFTGLTVFLPFLVDYLISLKIKCAKNKLFIPISMVSTAFLVINKHDLVGYDNYYADRINMVAFILAWLASVIIFSIMIHREKIISSRS